MKIRQSFRFKLLAWIVGINILLFGVIFAVNYHYVTDELSHDVQATAWAKMDYVIETLDETLTAAEVSTENMVSISKSPHIGATDKPCGRVVAELA